MSLYDIFGEDPVHEKTDDGRSSKKGLPSALRLLQSQIHIKKTQLAQQRSVVTPVVDLSAKSRPSKTTFLRPHKAMPLGDGPPLSFIPKALKEDKVFLFGEILVEDEYNPTAPTDYAKHKQKMDERKAKEKIAKEIAERLNREHQEEIAKRTAGAAIAPPKILMEEDSRVEPPASPDAGTTASEMPPPSFIPSFGAGKGLGVAANIMSKFGYKEGAGLGRSGQGMSTALKVERLGKNSGVIVNEHELNARAEASVSPPPLSTINATPAANMTEALKQSSRILLLRNMVSPAEIDDQLEPEVKDEMKKYGQVNKVVIFRLLQASDDEAVRIFVEFTNVGQAIKAFVDLNGRFFGGRSIKASFYDLEAYNANHFDR
ncbi:G-patch domain-containing protein [Loa loa]|uniref:Splicing factor 45 n=1 Tax=Loa loa TaxID=7209 RepID=A0A1I7VZ45_LOALO|nr:G-patch domain-containing protein [Loa loa]EFO25312.1 G-patch domain-containing protein [Loa loa]